MSEDYFIWDSNIFLSFVKEIKYFASLNLITEDDVAHLKDELYQLLSVMETLSVKGEFSEGRKVSFYLSNIDFEATYTYIEKQDYQVSLLRCIPSIRWIRKVRKSVRYSGTGFNH